MKKFICLFFLGFIGFQSQAQESSDLQQKAVSLIEMTSGQQFDIMLDPIVKMIPEKNQEAFKNEMMASLDDVYTRLAKIYTEKFTEEELDQILAFYNTPVGKKMRDITPELTKRGMEIGQEWGMQLQPIMMKYMQE
ncbi:hypothetical protein SAMN04488034_102277 [Salinimicrobium catena]|uniref:DUF2059 domain-containing protein n=1 Tax=Salinimicrobium catena TaxID=390640 RepID=A0A1H5LI19_9FLAO|nr:DUF2059 domain-containing protein [Salinimicrobium catena]SDL09783.1 hypothetical protein SAMN04488140_102277 [Salinimicrobium catena]SEE76071.1 hypothetical protein SAMN04488034_102277 [Salinimicrobium catena]